MSLLNRVANREVFDFLKTVTIKSTYFANKTRRDQIRPNIEKFIPETANPYTIHLAGEYLIDVESLAYRQYDNDRIKAVEKRGVDLSIEQDSINKEQKRIDEEGGTQEEIDALNARKAKYEDDFYQFKIDSMEANHRGFRFTKDHSPRLEKNYWRVSPNGQGLTRVPRSEYIDSYTGLPKDGENGVHPDELFYFEIRPFIVKGVPDPIGGGIHDVEIPVSQFTYDSDGRLANEMKNNDIYVDGIYDQMMYVTSLDVKDENGNGVTIPFCLETLHAEYAPGNDPNRVHSKTLEAYRLPGKYFDQLCKRYPNQVDLIKAIVYPVKSVKVSSLMTLPELEALLRPSSVYQLDGGGPYKIKRLQSLATEEYIADLKRRFPNKFDFIKKMGADLQGYRDFDPSKNETDNTMLWSEARRTRIANAKNFELLEYDVSRLDETEQVSILEHTVQFLNIIARRWAVDGFNFEENYAATLWTLMWTLLPVAIIAKRYANIKTPFVSEQHMWDYLTSKGLGDYKGYLTIDQTWFMYKNIQYLMQHAGQQLTMNILIDNLLSYYGLTLKAKTVVLDTTDSLKKMSKPATPDIQCRYCARYNVSCFKNITEHWCDEWLDTKTLCKASPIVLTEDFAGANKEKIITALMKSYGLTEEEANRKYRRSFIWRDSDIEALKDDMDRDQLVDMTGKVDSLEVTIESEHVCGQEPVVNDDIVDQQTVELQHMNGTVAPTKLLELSKKQYNAKFAELFNRFVTETLLRFAPYYDKNRGKFVPRVVCSYGFATTESVAEFSFEYGELLAASYLGFIREYLVDVIIDHLKTTEDGGIRKQIGKIPYGIGITLPDGTKATITLPSGDPIELLEEGSWTQEYLTDVVNKFSYNIKIPSMCKTTTAFKYGIPVLQEELADQYINNATVNLENIENDVVYEGENTPVIITIDGDTNRPRYYKVVETDEDPTHMWEDLGIVIDGKLLKLKILGSYTKIQRFENGVSTSVFTYRENDDEIPVIPKFFRWYYTHLNPDLEEVVSKCECGHMVLTKRDEAKICGDCNTVTDPTNALEENSAFMKAIPLAEHLDQTGYVPNEMNTVPANDTDMVFHISDDELRQIQTGYTYIDSTKGEVYRLFNLRQFLDVDTLIKSWIEVPDTIRNQEDIANYIDTMFTILEKIYCFASQSGSIRTHLACKEFLERVLCQKQITFDLTGCADFKSWIQKNEDTAGAFKIIDNMRDSALGWNEFNTTVIQQLLRGCTIPYAKNIITDIQYNKLKQLVLSLSSYRITIMDETETDRVCNSTASLAEDALLDHLELEEHIYFDPIGDSEWAPRVGGFVGDLYILTKDRIESKCVECEHLEFKDGDIMVPTTDLRRDADKIYFELMKKDSDVYNNHDSKQVLSLKNWPLAYQGDVDEGALIGDPNTGAPIEMVNLPMFTTYKPYRLTTDEYVGGEVTEDDLGFHGTKYFKYNPEMKNYAQVKLEDLEGIPATGIWPDDVIPAEVYSNEVDGVKMVYPISSLSLYEEILGGERLPCGICYEKINLYDLLGLTTGTPLLITRDEKWNWYYRTGVVVDNTVVYPAANSKKETYKTEQLDVEASDDKFDLKNEFSNSRTAVDFPAPVYRINVPVQQVEWDEPIQSTLLEHYLYPTVNHHFILEETTEPSLLMEESEYPTPNNNEGNNE